MGYHHRIVCVCVCEGERESFSTAWVSELAKPSDGYLRDFVRRGES